MSILDLIRYDEKQDANIVDTEFGPRYLIIYEKDDGLATYGLDIVVNDSKECREREDGIGFLEIATSGSARIMNGQLGNTFEDRIQNGQIISDVLGSLLDEITDKDDFAKKYENIERIIKEKNLKKGNTHEEFLSSIEDLIAAEEFDEEKAAKEVEELMENHGRRR